MFSIGQKVYPETIDVFNAGIEAPQEDNFHESDFVFMFHDVEPRFGRFCADWLQFCIEQREALACYNATVYFSLPDALRLVSITQALEAYHQRFYRPKTDVKFKDRIKQLCNIQRHRIEQLVGDIEQFATVVTDSRDYYTHHHPSIRNRGTVATGVKLTMMSYHLQFVFRLCVLSQFGLAGDRFGVLTGQIPSRVVDY
jgi:ApeA N-terminal domain 1